MTTFAAVTSFNLAGLDRYAYRMVESFLRFWPQRPNDVPLLIYSEDRLPIDDVRAMPAWLDEFKLRHKNNPDARGMRSGRYDYTRDCIRFAHKVAAVTDATMTNPADVLIWLDADTLTHTPVTQAWLESLIDPDAYIAWLDRVNVYPECGFYTLALKHPAHERIMQNWVGMYETDAVLAMSQTHDCVSLQKVIVNAQLAGEIKVQSLSGDVGRNTSHPFCNSCLAEKMDHLKGPRKDQGRSRASDLKVKRMEAHWQ